tara:strand:+ start:1415 stop:2173 length:759 start_codon:yes stop_codon:yes gene_type:complete
MDQKNILIIGGHDPTGGAGISADHEAAYSKNIRVLSIISCLTVQNSSKVSAVHSVPKGYITQCYNQIRKEFKINGIKIGLIPSLNTAKEIFKIINKKENKNIPIVLDPILTSGSKYKFLKKNIQNFLMRYLIKNVDVITPNLSEYKIIKEELSKKQNYRLGNILITNYKENENFIFIKNINSKNNTEKIYKVKRYKKNYHGTGCTFSTKLLCELTLSKNFEESVQVSLNFMKKVIKSSKYKGIKQYFLNRIL